MTDENNNSLAMFTEERFEPCKVCGEPSSGWHCGSITCEKFFLRSINGEDAKYKCLRNQDCVIVRTTRTQCQYCRFQKCKEVGMTVNVENANNPTVAELFKGFPCQVCKAPSSGVHFGSITCEGCKGFFRRSIKERAPEKYKCLEGGNCEISVATRNMCRHCRFQRCIMSGMSAANSRIGRQSNLFKHQIIEWQSKGLVPASTYLISQRKMKRVKSESTFIANSNSNSSSSSMNMNTIMTNQHMKNYEQVNHNSMQPIQNINNCVNNINNINTSNMNINIINQQHIIQNHHYNSEFIPINNDLYSNQNIIDVPQNYHLNNYNNGQQTANISHSNNNTYYSWSSNALPNMASNQMIDNNSRMIQQKPHQNQVVCIEDSLEDSVKCTIKVIYQSYTEYLSTFAEAMNSDLLKNNTFNNNMNYSNYNQINSTYVEILKYLSFYAKKISIFSQNIPGLSQLTSEDKDELVKCSIHSVVLLSIQRRCNFCNYFNCDSQKLDKFLKKLPKLGFTTYFMKSIHDKFEKFKLDDKEYGLYSALLVISTASKNLKEYDKIMEVRESIGTALRKYMFARRNEEITCDEILLMLNHFRKTNSVLQNGMVEFYNKVTEANMDAFKDYQFFFRVYMPNSLNSISLQ